MASCIASASSIEEEIEQLDPAEKESMMEVRKSWRERDRDEFRQEFLQQGRQEGMLLVMTHQIEQRLGPIDTGLRDRISQLTSEQLGSLSEARLEFKEVGDLTKWLEGR